MNPKICISIDSSNRATAISTGIVSVGSLVDVEILGMPDIDTIPNWTADDDYIGYAIRFRIVDNLGKDLVRYQLKDKHHDTPDVWIFDTVSKKFIARNVDFNTDALRNVFRYIPFNEYLELGIIIDSVVDSIEYAVGKMKIRQWSAASIENPTMLPDWRETLHRIKHGVHSIKKYHDETLEAKDAAETAASHYPKIGANGNWFSWDVIGRKWFDTGFPANGGHDIFKGKVFEKPTSARQWYELLSYLIVEMGGNIQLEGIVPGPAPTAITMKASDGTSKSVRVVKHEEEYKVEAL